MRVNELLTLVEGNTFMISAPGGDVEAGTSQGLFFADTRFLSKLAVTMNGWPPQLLRSKVINNYAASIYATNPTYKEFATRTLGIIRDRFVGDGVHEDIVIQNHGDQSCPVKLQIDFGCDFADIFEVKGGQIKKSKPVTVGSDANMPLIFSYERLGLIRRTLIAFAKPATIQGKSAFFNFTLSPGETWKTCVNIHLATTKKTFAPKCQCGEFDKLALAPSQAKKRWLESLPELSTDNDDLQHLFERSIFDLAALLFEVDGQLVPAAGVPWFMTLFGRDSIITALQSMPISVDPAIGTLRILAKYQGKQVDDFREEAPGKILHEVRFGQAALLQETPHARYYGSVDATPLWLILLGETYRWTADLNLVKELLPAAKSALEWIDNYGDLDGDGFVEYRSRSEATLTNQGWKDSRDAVVFADGRLAEGPIALVEVQGYVYRAKLSMADLYRRLGDATEVGRLEDEAIELKRRFNERFWLPDASYFALALDGQKQAVDSITSNPGHCLWSGIVGDDKAQAIAERIVADDMFSGWGVRTMSEQMKRFNPLAYHNGSVWPHDNSIIAAGLTAYGFYEQAHKVILAMLEAAASMDDYRLPELFAGYRRRPAGFPVPYPTASSPQAWATGAAFLFFATLLGLQAHPQSGNLTCARYSAGIIGKLRLKGVKAFGRRLTLSNDVGGA